MMRVLVIAMICTFALVQCQVPENAVVQEAEPLVESLVQFDAAEEAKTNLPDGVTEADADETLAHAPTNNDHDDVSCDVGEVLCPDGSCAAECPKLELQDPSAKYSYTFKPDPTVLSRPPSVAGRKEDYEAQATNALGTQTDMESRAITSAEQSAGLNFASHDAALDQQTQQNAAKKVEVEKLMNIAAAHAADFKSKSAEHDTSVANVKKSKIEEQKQAEVVAQAKATLAAEEANLKKAKEHVTAMENEEQNRRYSAEYAGQQYETAKATAIKADDDLQEQIHETLEKDHFRKVAREAVEKAAKAELAKVHSTKATPAAASTETCADCTTLPAIYTQAGGSCADCADWAKKGECDASEYKQFMGRYCAKACGCKAAAPANLEQTDLKMPTKAKVSK
jgi:hypothetical protein